MYIQDYLAMALALITALVAIRGETWDVNKGRPTKTGLVATGLATVTFIIGIWGLRSQQEVKVQNRISAVEELLVAINLIKMELLGYQHSLAFSSVRPGPGELREQCKYSLDVVTRHRDIFYPELSVSVNLLRSACDLPIGSSMTWDESENMLNKVGVVKDEVCLKLGHEYLC